LKIFDSDIISLPKIHCQSIAGISLDCQCLPSSIKLFHLFALQLKIPVKRLIWSYDRSSSSPFRTSFATARGMICWRRQAAVRTSSHSGALDIVPPKTVALLGRVGDIIGAYPDDVVPERWIRPQGLPEFKPVPHEAPADDIVYGGRDEIGGVEMPMRHGMRVVRETHGVVPRWFNFRENSQACQLEKQGKKKGCGSE